ncbi:hypothetical protein KM176_23785 [Pseudooceanicola sp. CBS1P-1]|uniref:Uncharacterized protein n=1 Tax=Pseudooceanicola albus TaxID=2692189 RepID=A0A6L7GB26_9RHOB|nr:MULTISPECIES: hypothetical protein [Pseudooceanicola]MBT9386340.1 hypothetical protein [Pseudooceanicola endophyticus]MBT9386884.1 hypothetical protein [Pseudooceanicola endophyticus]MXN21179.1 hypothetical protein [Pseudooceanicola albus]MXN21226.1 hypothetical protein [Pseudooceanicola albus]
MTNIYVRLILYVLSPLLTALVALLPGWGIGFGDGVLTIDLSTLAGALVAALGLSAGVFAKWGIK